MKRVIVTGVAGFIGRYVARQFSEQGWSVIGVSNASPENAPLADLSQYYSLQLPNRAFDEIVKKHSPEACIHCAGRASVGQSVINPAADFYDSTVLTFEILNALKQNVPNCKLVFLSSAAVYGNPDRLPVSENQLPAPLSPYGYHKWQCEQLCSEFSKIYGLPTASIRIFSAYGVGLRRQVIWDICQKVLTGKSLVLQGTGMESRDFIHAHDIARAIETIIMSGSMNGEVYNLASGREVTISELAKMIINSLDVDITPTFDGVIPIGNPLNWEADISKITDIGFTPSISLEEGIKTFTEWCKIEHMVL